MVDEIVKDMDNQTQKFIQAIQRGLELAAQREQDPLVAKLKKQLAKLPSSEQMMLAYHPDNAKAVRQFCIDNKIPFCQIDAHSGRVWEQPGVIIPKVYAEKVEEFVSKLERTNPNYFQQSTASLFVHNAKAKGFEDVVCTKFDTREEADRFRNKMYNDGEGELAGFTKDPKGDGYLLFFSPKAAFRANPSEIDLTEAFVEEAVNRMDPDTNRLKDAQVKWDFDQQMTFSANIESLLRGRLNTPIYLTDSEGKGDAYIKLDAKSGITVKDKKGKSINRYPLSSLKELAKDGDSFSMASSILSALSKDIDSIHNMKVCDKKEFENISLRTDEQVRALKEKNNEEFLNILLNGGDFSTIDRRPNNLTGKMLDMARHAADGKLTEKENTIWTNIKKNNPTVYRMLETKTLKDDLSAAINHDLRSHFPKGADPKESAKYLQTLFSHPDQDHAIGRTIVKYQDLIKTSPEGLNGFLQDLREIPGRFGFVDVKTAKKVAEKGDDLFTKAFAKEAAARTAGREQTKEEDYER